MASPAGQGAAQQKLAGEGNRSFSHAHAHVPLLDLANISTMKDTVGEGGYTADSHVGGNVTLGDGTLASGMKPSAATATVASATTGAGVGPSAGGAVPRLGVLGATAGASVVGEGPDASGPGQSAAEAQEWRAARQRGEVRCSDKLEPRSPGSQGQLTGEGSWGGGLSTQQASAHANPQGVLGSSAQYVPQRRPLSSRQRVAGSDGAAPRIPSARAGNQPDTR